MEWYELTRSWVRVHELLLNRVKCINHIACGACEVTQRGARYRLLLWGCVVAEWRAYDLESVRSAFSLTEGIERACWHSRRLGYASFRA